MIKEDGLIRFSKEEKVLLDLLKLVFTVFENDLAVFDNTVHCKLREEGEKYLAKAGTIYWKCLLTIAEKHGVLSLLFDVLGEGEFIPQEFRNNLKNITNKIVLQNYHLLFLSRTIVDMLNANNIDVVLLKGCGTAAFYPVAELRKSGDVDLLLLNPKDIDRVEKILSEAGLFREKEQLANHHVVYSTKENIDIELHIMIAEPFDNKKTNLFIENIYKNCSEHIVYKDAMGIILPFFDDGYHIYYLLLHMLQHFLRSGFGLKLFCDWVAFWRFPVEKKHCDNFLQLIKGSGLEYFAKMVTASCIGYLGLSAKNVEFLFGRELLVEEAKKMSFDMMQEVLEAEEFGKSSSDRMVIIRNTGFMGYVREFHHQMRLNYPKASKLLIIWPFLWIITFVRFAINNKKIRNISGSAVLKKAKKRSKLVESLKLFEVEK